uniref:leucine--tRNA ligase n=1 Tax=Cacopsylla melanoneura TaxID=428564 RepID=A0A8D8ZZD4_9HEMI
MVHCGSCGTLPVPLSSLPVTLPPSPPLPLSHHTDWQRVQCPRCGAGDARRETDTMDTFVDSSWYYARYLDPNNTECAFSAAQARSWLPVDLYVGGKEHAVLHLYYARFVAHFLHAQGRTPTREPFKRLLVQGMIMGQTHREQSTGKYLKPDEVYTEGGGGGGKKSTKSEGTVYSVATREPVTVSWEKMSKSKHNGVNPAYLVKQYGVDTMRLFVLCDVAPTSQKNWSHAAFPGILNWQVKLWLLVKDYLRYSRDPDSLIRTKLTPEQTAAAEHKLCAVRNQTVRAVTYAYSRNHQLNAAICRLQSYTTSLRNTAPSIKASSPVYSRYVAELLTMLAPMTPHLSCFLWECCEFPGHLWDTSAAPSWPQVDDHWPLSFRVLIHKKPILTVPVVKSELVKLSKGTALALLVEQVRANEKTMAAYRYLLDLETELSEENEHIQFSIDPNEEAVLTLPLAMKRAKPDETDETNETQDEETRGHG